MSKTKPKKRHNARSTRTAPAAATAPADNPIRVDLTVQQTEAALLSAIREFYQRHGYPPQALIHHFGVTVLRQSSRPSVDQMCRMFDLIMAQCWSQPSQPSPAAPPCPTGAR